MRLSPPPLWARPTDCGSAVSPSTGGVPGYQAALPTASAPKMDSASNVAPETTSNPHNEVPNNSAGEIDLSHGIKIDSIIRETVKLDLYSALWPAKKSNFAMIYGRGGEYGPNSAIRFQLCGHLPEENRPDRTVRATLNVSTMAVLMQAAEDAMLGKLKPRDSSPSIQAAQQQVFSLSNKHRLSNGTIPVTPQELNALYATLASASSSEGYEGFPVVVEKNNPWKKRKEDNYCEVSKIIINYTPRYKGQDHSDAPWNIYIENFWAPLIDKGPHTISPHDSSKAVDKQSLYINVSKAEFHRAMLSVASYIGIWEFRSFDTIDKICTQFEENRTRWIEERSKRAKEGKL